MGKTRGTYREEPPEHYEGSQEDWNSLSYQGQQSQYRKNKTYCDTPPDSYDGTQKEWDELSYNMQYYYCKESRRDYLRDNNRNVHSRNKKYVSEIKEESCCTECGEDHIATLNFHHTGNNKVDNVADLVRKYYSLEVIQEEIDKCIILCANCHRKHHYNERLK